MIFALLAVVHKLPDAALKSDLCLFYQLGDTKKRYVKNPRDDCIKKILKCRHLFS